MKILDLFRKKTNPPNIMDQKEIKNSLEVKLGRHTVDLSIFNYSGLRGQYSVVCMFNPKFPQWGWRELSPYFYELDQGERTRESRVHQFLNSVLLSGDDDIDYRRIIFLECLHRHCVENRVEWFFYYVVGMLRYFSTCFVKDDSRIEICINHQLADMGDEFFEMAYEVSKELGLKPVNDSFNMDCLTPFPKDTECASRGYDKGGKNGHLRFLHIGSDTKGLLQVQWKVDLKDIKTGEN